MEILNYNSINFCGNKADKLIKQIIESHKTPRSIKTDDYITIIESLGFKRIRTTGSHFHYVNELGEKIMFKGNTTNIDPKMLKILRQQIAQGKININI